MAPRRVLAALCATFALAAVAAATTVHNDDVAFQVTDLRVEYLTDPLSLDVNAPRFSWQVASLSAPPAPRGVHQVSYRLVVSAEGGAVTWDSGVVRTPEATTAPSVAYAGPALPAGGVFLWTVELNVSTADSGVLTYPAQPVVPGSFSVGLRERADWAGQFVALAASNDTNDTATFAPDPWFRTTFELPAAATAAAQAGQASALLYVASVGYCDASVNGLPASDTAVLVPSISYLPARVLYRTYNVTALLDFSAGAKNSLGLWAAAGWADYGDFVAAVDPEFGAHAPLVMAELRVGGVVVNGTATDASWRTRASTTSRLGAWGAGGFGGDAVDARLAVDGWDTPELDDSKWEQAVPVAVDPSITVSADVMEPTVRNGEVAAVNVTQVDAQTVLIEMAELYTGWFEVANLAGAAGDSVNFSVSTTAGVTEEWSMRDQLTFAATGAPTDFRMRFSYHEIQYITIVGNLTSPVAAADVKGYRLFVGLERQGAFECASPLLNRIYNTTVDNYQGLTTGGMTVDCPHRERRGYGGDGHTSYEFALANYGAGAYFTKWARDFADVQTPDGNVPHTAPTVSGGGGPAWSGFVVTMPWQMYRQYGDTALLETMYPTMKRLLAFYTNHTSPQDGLLRNWTNSSWDFLGDWITPHGSESNQTSPENILFNNAYLSYITKLAANIAQVLNKPTDAAVFNDAVVALDASINEGFYDADTGAYIDLLQTHLVMPLAADVVMPASQALVLGNLEDAIQLQNGHLDTGLTGTYFMTKFLTENARNDLMFTMANKTTFPSYGYFLEQGFTTWPEQWNVSAPGLSRMHGCFNAIGLWFLEGVAGITVDATDPTRPPLTFRAAVEISQDVPSASGSRHAIHGTASAAWRVAVPGATPSFEHNISVPTLTTAYVLVPVGAGAGDADVLVDGAPLSTAKDAISVHGLRSIGAINYVQMYVKSGDYAFTSNFTARAAAAHGRAHPRVRAIAAA